MLSQEFLSSLGATPAPLPPEAASSAPAPPTNSAGAADVRPARAGGRVPKGSRPLQEPAAPLPPSTPGPLAGVEGGEAPAVPPTGDADAGPPALGAATFLEGNPATIAERFEVLAAEQLEAERRAVAAARAAMAETASEAERAALDVPPAERALLRDRTPAAHAALEAARAAAARTTTTAELARRQLAAEEARLQLARRHLANQLFEAAVDILHRERFLAKLIGPYVERLWKQLLSVHSDVRAIEGLLAARRGVVNHGYQLAQLAGVDLRALGAEGKHTGAIDGRGGLRDVDLGDVLGWVRRQITERAKAARLPAGLSDWLSPW